jgi:hypothetical protein
MPTERWPLAVHETRFGRLTVHPNMNEREANERMASAKAPTRSSLRPAGPVDILFHACLFVRVSKYKTRSSPGSSIAMVYYSGPRVCNHTMPFDTSSFSVQPTRASPISHLALCKRPTRRIIPLSPNDSHSAPSIHECSPPS